MEENIFYPLKEFPGYAISKDGVVKSLQRKIIQAGVLRSIPGRILKPSEGYLKKCHDFYYVVGLRNQNGVVKHKRIHRLVAETFLPNPENKPCVNHISGIKTDNRLENLEWCTYSENSKHAFITGLSNLHMKGKTGSLNHFSKPIIKMDMDGNFIQEYESLSQTGLSNPNRITKCCDGKKEQYCGFKWAWKQKEQKF